MKVFITGIDGYLGWSLAVWLTHRNYEVWGFDNGIRRELVKRSGSNSAIPICGLRERAKELGIAVPLSISATDYALVKKAYQDFEPDVIVYLGEIPSAPYSMQDYYTAEETQINNTIGTLATLWAMYDVCPQAHLLKLGTMGEFGTPNVPIPEKGPHEFPRQGGSYYHNSKIHDSVNVEFACRNWGLRSTDVMQGVVYGTSIPEMRGNEKLATRFDFDEMWGTAINRFVAQAIVELPITPYGVGKQQRGFLPLQDSMQCLQLAIDNPPEYGEYRVFNQLEEVYRIDRLAQKVALAADECFNLDVEIRHEPNPRNESEDHYYRPRHQKLIDLGYCPTSDMDAQLRIMIEELLPYRDRILQYADSIKPKTQWCKEGD